MVTPGLVGPSTSSKYEGLAAAIVAELMIGFWFGIGVVLAVKMLESLEYCTRRKCYKMAEENQVQQEPQQVTAKEPQRVTTKDPKKVETDKRLAAINHKKREVKKREEQAQLEKTTSRVNQYYGFGTILAVGVIGGLDLFIGPRMILQPPSGVHGSQKTLGEMPQAPSEKSRCQSPNNLAPRLTSLRWINLFYTL